MAYIKKQVAQLADKDSNPLIGNAQTTVLGSSIIGSTLFCGGATSTLLGLMVYQIFLEHGLIKGSAAGESGG